MITLYNYYRSGPSYRVRIALAFKGLDYTYEAVNLLAHEQKSDENRARHPQGFVPTLDSNGDMFTQSPAILEWLEEAYPEPPLLPKPIAARQRVRAMAAVIGCDVHPLNNIRIMGYLKKEFGADDAAQAAWARKWMGDGFAALERMIGEAGDGKFCYGDTPTLADVYLIPQLFTAQRFKLADLSLYPRIARANENALSHPAFIAAHPSKQPDAV